MCTKFRLLLSNLQFSSVVTSWSRLIPRFIVKPKFLIVFVQDSDNRVHEVFKCILLGFSIEGYYDLLFDIIISQYLDWLVKT